MVNRPRRRELIRLVARRGLRRTFYLVLMADTVSSSEEVSVSCDIEPARPITIHSPDPSDAASSIERAIARAHDETRSVMARWP